jgi:hypothetical protein
MSVVPETQPDISILEEIDEVEEVEFEPRSRQEMVPVSMTKKPSFEVSPFPVLLIIASEERSSERITNSRR